MSASPSPRRRSGSHQSCRIRAATACGSFGGRQRSSPRSSGSAPSRDADDGHACGHRLERRVAGELVVAGGHEEHRRASELALHSRPVQATDEVHGRADHVRQLHQLRGGGALTRHAQRDVGERRGLDGRVDSLLRAEPCRDERVTRRGGAAFLGKRLGGEVVGDDVDLLRRNSQQRRLPGRVETRGDEAVDASGWWPAGGGPGRSRRPPPRGATRGSSGGGPGTCSCGGSGSRGRRRARRPRSRRRGAGCGGA